MYNEFINIKTVFIDVDDTLLDFGRCASVSMRAAAAAAEITLPEDFEALFHRVNNSLWKRVEGGSLTVPELYKIRWNLIFGEAGIDFDGVAFENVFLKELAGSAEHVIGAQELLEHLKSRNYVLYSASNAPQLQQEKRLAKAGFLRYFKAIFTSESVGAQKPSREFFEKAMARGGVADKDSCVMIGDSFEADISGAAAFGIKTVWVDRKGVSAEHPGVATRVVKELGEIKGLL